MRKHRLYGVVVAALLGMGVILHRPGVPDHEHEIQARTTRLAMNGKALSLAAFHRASDPHGSYLPTRMTPAVLPSTGAPLGDVMVALQELRLPPPPASPPRPAAVPAPRPAPVPAPAPPPSVAPDPAAAGGEAWAALRECESGGNYATDTGNGYYGAYQFSLATWQALGYSGLPSEAPPAIQDQAAAELQARDGWGAWPACSRELGL
jgi:hypothetical protein